MKKLFAINLIITFITQAHHNTYQGKEITPETLITLAPPMTANREKETNELLQEHQEFIANLVTTPHPLTHELRSKKTDHNKKLIADYTHAGHLANLSSNNYVLKFNTYPQVIMPINKWGNRIAYLIYASDQGDITDPHFDGEFDCSRLEYLPSYQHCSRVAYYLRFKEIAHIKSFKHVKTTPTYLKHIPGKPTTLSDEHYVVIQELIDNLEEIKHFSQKKQRAVFNAIPHKALEEIYHAIVYAALWDIGENLAITKEPDTYYLVDLEEPFNHKPQFFFFQGEKGKKKYVKDVIDGLERMAAKLMHEPKQLDHWKKFTEDDYDFKQLCTKYNIEPNYDYEYLATKD